jgi:tRNA pseudouridine32 synthase/23S rRNA pseudouridine746 synthase
MLTPVFDHRDFAIFCKPSGVSVHSEASAGFVAQLQSAMPGSWHLVHRLDKTTSGLLLVARSATAAMHFGELFSQRRIDKYYLAVAPGKPLKKQGLIIGGMARARNGQWKLTRDRVDPAVTRFFSASLSPGLRAYLLRPYTGRTHQLRVAMKSLGVPILGDDRYGGEPTDRLHLHAYALAFDWHGERIEVIQPPTDGSQFATIGCLMERQGWSQPWTLTWPPLPASPRAASDDPGNAAP